MIDLPSESILDVPYEDKANAVARLLLPGSDPTMMQTVYEACNQNLIEERLKTGTVLQSESVNY